MAPKKSSKKQTEAAKIAAKPIIEDIEATTMTMVANDVKPAKTTTSNTTAAKSNNKKEVKAVAAPTVTESKKTQTQQPAVQAVVEPDLTGSVEVPEKKKKSNAATKADTAATTTNVPVNNAKTLVTPQRNSGTSNANTSKKQNSTFQFHLLGLDEDGDDVDTQQPTTTTTTNQKSNKSNTTAVSNENSAKKQQQLQQLHKEQKKKAEKAAVKEVKEMKKEKQRQEEKLFDEHQKQQKEEIGWVVELMESIVTPGVPSSVFKIIYMALILLVILSPLPLIIAGIDKKVVAGFFFLIFALAVCIFLFVREYTRLKFLKSNTPTGKSSKSKKLKTN
eukprot:gene7413-9113_t